MFTGLIQGLGRVDSIERRGHEARLGIVPLFPTERLQVGESVAVNGACLTLEALRGNGFEAYASAESLARTTLGWLRQGDKVNLERALALGERMGGHLVTGHIDCMASVETTSFSGESTGFRLIYPPEYDGQVAAKGSVALDGISLTVNNVGIGWLEVNVIPETLRATTVSAWRAGAGINMETDLIAKYVERMLGKQGSTQGGSNISEEFLKKHGF
jgi:riboflavin synthase